MRADLPPEAFSKEMLSEAFNWLQTQPESLREIVQTPEHLVALYRKYTKDAVESEAPVSAKQFSSTLKDLAKGLEKFADRPVTAKAAAATPPPVTAPTPANSTAAPTAPPPTSTATPSAPVPTLKMGLELDERTLSHLRETARRLNLSSDLEALRMLVALGYEKVSKL